MKHLLKKSIDKTAIMLFITLFICSIDPFQPYAQTINKAISVDAGVYHYGVILEDGSLWMWGDNECGQLGDGTTTTRNSNKPVKVMNNVLQVSCGGGHTAAIKTDGSLWMWGINSFGQLGDGTTTTRKTPVKVMDNVSQVSCGTSHTAAIKTDGTLWMWGNNESHNEMVVIGDSYPAAQYSPVKVMENVCKVNCGWDSTLVLKQDNTLWQWGFYNDGGLQCVRSTPTKIMENVASFDSDEQSAAIKTDGSLWTWGRYNSTPSYERDSVTEVSLEGSSTAAIASDGKLWVWGDNSRGQLGIGSSTSVSAPYNTIDNVSHVALNAYGGTAIKNDGTIWVWGSYVVINGMVTSAPSPIQTMFNIDESGETQRYTISYDANGGSNAPVAQEKVNGVDLKLSSSIPTRSDYSFKGWSLDKNSTTAQYQPGGIYTLEGNRTLYAVWEKSSSAWSRNNEFSWSNSSTNFNTGKYTMLDSDYKKLCTYLDKMGYSNYKSKITKEMNSTWGGSCFGMAAVALLDYTEQIGFNENFDTGKTTLREVSSPNKNRKVMSAINYYFMAQFIPPTRNINHMYEQGSSTWTNGLKQLVTKAKAGEKMLFCYFWDSYGHAIVIKGYDGTDSNGNHKLIAYDNRYPNRDVIVKVSNNYYNCVIDGSESAYFVEYASDLSAYDKIDIDGPNNDMVLANATNSNNQQNSKTDIYIPASGEVTIESNSGDYIVVSDGSITETTMEVQDEHLVVYSKAEGGNEIGEVVITVEDSDSFSFSSNTHTIKASVVADNYYGEVKAENATSVTMSEQEGTYLFGDRVEYTLFQSVNEDTFDMFSCSGQTSGDAKISYSNDRINITGHGGGDIAVGRYNDGESEEVSFNSQKRNVTIRMNETENNGAENNNEAKTNNEAGAPCDINGHSFGNWTITQEATELAAGQKTRTCTVCGNVEMASIAQLAPTLPAVKISKPKAAKKSAIIRWKKISKKNLKKFKKIQIQYSTDKSFAANVKSMTASAKKTSKKIKGLKSKKKYYIRIRAINGNHVSAWSGVKSVKAK